MDLSDFSIPDSGTNDVSFDSSPMQLESPDPMPTVGPIMETPAPIPDVPAIDDGSSLLTQLILSNAQATDSYVSEPERNAVSGYTVSDRRRTTPDPTIQAPPFETVGKGPKRIGWWRRFWNWIGV